MWPIILWWGVFEGLGLLAFPLCFGMFSRAAGHGYAFSKIAALLLITYVSWLGGYVIPMPLAVGGTLAALAAGGLAAGWMQRSAIRAWFRAGGSKAVLRYDLLWTAGFLFFAWHRAMSPDVFGAEKFMDFAFLNTLSRTDGMPPPDPWMSGKMFNYYYFGYLMFADLLRIVPLPAYVSYNLCVASIGGLAFSQTAAIVLHLTGRLGLAMLGGAISVVLGNLDGFLQLLERGRLTGMDVWRSSRVVGRFLDPTGRDATTINEFPFFSTIHGDLHPHFMVFPVSILLIGILLDEKLFPSTEASQPRGAYRPWLPYLIVSFVFGAMIAISNWELPIGALLIAVLAGRWQPLLPLFSKARLMLVARVAAVLLAARYVWFLPSYLAIDLAPAGVGARLAQSSLAEFLTVFGLLLFPPALLVGIRAITSVPGGAEMRHLLLAAAALAAIVAAMAGNAVLPLLAVLFAATVWVAYAHAEPDERGGYLLVAVAVAALLACEVVYIKDAYGERLYRMNTVFKLYFEAWTILAIAGPWAIDRLLVITWPWPILRQVFTGTLAALIAASACYPVGVTLDRWGVRRWTLNGNAYLEQEHPDDFAAITWLRRNVTGTPVILEASGNPYSYFARFSSNTGLPTVMGWANHEGLWRTHESEVGLRNSLVQKIYSAPTLEEVQPLLHEYQVRYVIVGEIERKLYPASGLQKFAGLEKVFEAGRAVIYRTRG
jgi:YYY domain-containing protein